MEFTGIIVKKTDQKEGVSKSGNPWSKATYLMEEGGGRQYPQSLVMDVFDGPLQAWLDANAGMSVTAVLEPKAREWNGRYYMDLRCVYVMREGHNVLEGAQPAARPQERAAGYTPSDDQLPF